MVGNYDMVELSCVMMRLLRFHPMGGPYTVLLLLVELSTIRVKSNARITYLTFLSYRSYIHPIASQILCKDVSYL